MRAKIHKFISTEGLTINDTRRLNEASRSVILEQLKAF
ncbi:hypothetical protein JCM19301_3963 [Jejuia pallidilutea]|nr:hypothetical protein JCM19301_3963 [Jejuia pallidilutea]